MRMAAQISDKKLRKYQRSFDCDLYYRGRSTLLSNACLQRNLGGKWIHLKKYRQLQKLIAIDGPHDS